MRTKPYMSITLCVFLLTGITTTQAGDDLKEIQERGILRHLGTPYANFVTGTGEGFEVELMQQFAKSIGVKYEYVPSRWSDFIPDLTGQQVKPTGDTIEVIGKAEIRGDVIGSGFTKLPWRAAAVAYSSPTFPTQVWMLVRADSKVQPIEPAEKEEHDIAAVMARMKGLSILCKAKTCLDPSLYGLKEAGAQPALFEGGLNDLAPALLAGEADGLILDVPDCLIAINKWPGRFKIIGPVSKRQVMGAAFRKDAPDLLKAYEDFLRKSKQDGTYEALVRKYYPDVFVYYPEFFNDSKKAAKGNCCPRRIEVDESNTSK